MSLVYGFFDGAQGDTRSYTGVQFAAMLALFFTNGLKSASDLAVTAGTGLDVNVAAGYAHINGYWVQNTAVLNLAVGANTSGLSRIDRVVVRLSLATRTFSIVVKAGIAASAPAAPTLTRDASTYEISLAQILVTNDATTVTTTDERSDANICGYINNLNINITSGSEIPETLPTGDIFIYVP